MLPRRLCEQLCSLQPGEPRLAFSAVWEVDEATGDVRDEWMGRSVIQSCGQLHYAHAQHVVELPPGRAAESCELADPLDADGETPVFLDASYASSEGGEGGEGGAPTGARRTARGACRRA